MSSNWNSVTVVGDPGTGAETPVDGHVGEQTIESYTDADETTTHLVVGTDDGLVRETDDWQTVEQPGTHSGVVVIVTDRRVVFVVGNCRDPDVDGDYVRSIDHADVENATATNSLFTTRFSVTDASGVVLAVTPTETDGLEAIATTIERATLRWQSANEFFDDFEKRLIAIEEAFAGGDDDTGRARRHRLIKELGDLGQTSSLNAVELPALDADCEAARTRLDHATCRGYWIQARGLIETGDGHVDAGELAEAVAAYRGACSAFQSLAETGGPTEAAFSDDSLSMDLGPFDLDDALIDRLDACRVRATHEDVAATAVWPPLVSGYEQFQSGLQRAGAELDIEPESVGETLDTVRQAADEAFADAIEAEERRGDDAQDDGDSEQARAHFENALELLDQRAAVTDEDDPDLRARLDEKIERSKWEWVGDE